MMRPQKENGMFIKAIKDATESLVRNSPKIDIEMKLNSGIEPKSEEPITIEEKWIWVEGYKGTNKNMQGCNNYQFEVGKRYDMPLDVKIVDCHAGFHLSLNLKDVFNHYDIGEGNRFFKVRALVREKDYNEYGKRTGRATFFGPEIRTKLASQSIEFIRELTLDEIFENVDEAASWSDEYKKLALECGRSEVRKIIRADELVKLGYSEAFAKYVVKKDRDAVAKIVASQPGLSMDMKALMIMNW